MALTLNLRLTRAFRMRFMFLVMASSIITLMIDRLAFPGWISAAAWGIGYSLLYGLYAWSTGDRLIQRLFIFGLAAGFTELMADAWLVHYTQTLVYPAGPRLASSPFYMPFSWLVVLMQLGYISRLMLRKWAVWKVCLLLMLLSGIMIPLYEYWAIQAGWWHYRNASMWLHVPHYIFAAEAILAFSIPLMVQRVAARILYNSILFGILQGIVMLLACFAAFYLFG